NNVGLPGQIKIRNSLAYSSTFAVLRVNNNSSDLSDIYPQTEIANNITVFTQSNAEQENFGSVISAGSANGSRNAFEYLARPQFGNRTVSNLSDFGFSETVTLGLKPNSIARTGASFEGADFSDPFFQNTQGELGAVTTTSGNWTLTSPWLTFE
ncbi:MAG: hypothetical protein H7Y03_01770, partial [Chitinophagaceae bacterium]|nr:hypothetical protein [Chitinophagaceae bacterium]